MSVVVRIRRQGGARIVTLPAALLTQIGADAGTALALDVQDGVLVAKPVAQPTPAAPRRYTLSELMQGAERLPELYRGVAGALDGASVGDEIG